jgi:hypothetical protein
MAGCRNSFDATYAGDHFRTQEARVGRLVGEHRPVARALAELARRSAGLDE